MMSEMGMFASRPAGYVSRLIQESLTNIHRHSGSKTAVIRLNRNDASVTPEVADQGKGFSHSEAPGSASPKYGVGIPGMKERVRRFGGTLVVLSNSGGTVVKTCIPIAPEPKSETRST